MAGTRVFVQEGIHDQLVKKLREKAKTWVVGDPFDPNVRQGPQVKALTLHFFCYSNCKLQAKSMKYAASYKYSIRRSQIFYRQNPR